MTQATETETETETVRDGTGVTSILSREKRNWGGTNFVIERKVSGGIFPSRTGLNNHCSPATSSSRPPSNSRVCVRNVQSASCRLDSSGSLTPAVSEPFLMQCRCVDVGYRRHELSGRWGCVSQILDLLELAERQCQNPTVETR